MAETIRKGDRVSTPVGPGTVNHVWPTRVYVDLDEGSELSAPKVSVRRLCRRRGEWCAVHDAAWRLATDACCFVTGRPAPDRLVTS